MSLLTSRVQTAAHALKRSLIFKTAYAALKRRSSTVAHDFASFSAAGEAVPSPNRLMSLLDVTYERAAAKRVGF